MTGHLDGVRHLAGRVLLTPNTTELAAMLDRPEKDVEQDQYAAIRRLTQATGAVVLSGGEVSYVMTPGDASWSCDAGPTALATAGSGDVKAGAVAGLLARGAAVEQAAVWGAWAHARAGELLGREMPGFLARDVLGAIPAQLCRVHDERTS